MEESVPFVESISSPVDTPVFQESAPTQSASYSDPISSFFGGIFTIIIIILIIILVVVASVGSFFGNMFSSGSKAAPVVKEKFGPPYPNCRTNGALAMF